MAPWRQGFSPAMARTNALFHALDPDAVDHDIRLRPIARVGLYLADFLDDIQSLDDFAKHRMLVIEVRCGSERDEELAAVGVGAGIGHRQDAGFAVSQCGVEFVGELVAGATVSLPERIAALDHEAVDHAMEHDAVV